MNTNKSEDAEERLFKGSHSGPQKYSPIVEFDIDSGFKDSDPHSLLYPMPVVVEVNEFTDASARDFERQFTTAMHGSQRVLPIVIDSPGGDEYPLLRMIDLIRTAQGRGYVVPTIATGRAMSCGAWLLAAGTKGLRYATPEATILIHESTLGAYGKSSELQNEAEFNKKLEARFWAFLDAACGKRRGYWERRVHANHHADLYLSAAEAKAEGLVNSVGLPTFKVSASINYIWMKPVEDDEKVPKAKRRRKT